MYKRDVGIVILACIAMLVALQQDAPFSFNKAWYHSTWGSSNDLDPLGFSLPAPVVADLNGDGHLEVVVILPDLKLQVLQPQPPGRRAGDGFAAAHVIASLEKLTSGKKAESYEQRPIAMAVGHLDPVPTELVRPPRKQVIVIVTEGWEVLCYDHNLKLMWHKETPVEMDFSTTIKEVAIHISPYKVLDTDRGMVVVGGSLERGDLEDDYDDDDDDDVYDADAFDDKEGRFAKEDRLLMGEEKKEADKAAHAHSAGEDEELQDVLSREEGSGKAGLDPSRHFSYYALAGGTGEERWHHNSEDFHKDMPDLAGQMRPQHDYRLEAEELEGRHFGEASCRDFRESILHVLPHAWASTHDTRLEAAHFAKHREGRGAQKASLADAARTHKGARATASVGHQATPDALARNAALQEAQSHASRKKGARGRVAFAQGLWDSLFGSGSTSHRHAHHARHAPSHPNALVAFLEGGIEVIHFFSGRPICKLHLPPGELHADVNGDGTMDHVQVYQGGIDEAEHRLDPAADLGNPSHDHAGSHCAMRVMSGIPPMQQLYEANLCHSQFLSRHGNIGDTGLFSHKAGAARGKGRSYAAAAAAEQEASVMSSPAVLTLPVFLPVLRPYSPAVDTIEGRWQKGRGGLVVVLSSKGVLTAVDERGKHAWQETLPLAWHHKGPAASTPSLALLALHTHGPPTTILASGASAAIVVSEYGRPLATLWLPHAPSLPLIAADFNGDGLTDIMALTPEGLFGWAQVQRVGVTTLPAVLLTLIIAMAVLAWGAQQQGPGQLPRAVVSGSIKAPSRRLRSTEYED